MYTIHGNRKKEFGCFLGQGHKDIRNFSLFGDEIANSQKMVSFRYKIPCFRNDGVYQLHRSIEETLVLLRLKQIKTFGWRPSGYS
jgi:hypothetical protein